MKDKMHLIDSEISATKENEAGNTVSVEYYIHVRCNEDPTDKMFFLHVVTPEEYDEWAAEDDEDDHYDAPDPANADAFPFVVTHSMSRGQDLLDYMRKYLDETKPENISELHQFLVGPLSE